jgi:hypothetical protein
MDDDGLPGCFRFTNPLFHQVILNLTPLSERQYIHTQIAQKMIDHEERSLECYLEIFQQYRSAQMNAAALNYAKKALRCALDSAIDIEIKIDCCVGITMKAISLCTTVDEVDDLIVLSNIAMVHLSCATSPVFALNATKSDRNLSPSLVTASRSNNSRPSLWKKCLCGFNNAVAAEQPMPANEVTMGEEISVTMLTKSFSASSAVTEIGQELNGVIEMLQKKRLQILQEVYNTTDVVRSAAEF